MFLFNFLCLFYATVALCYPVSKTNDKIVVVPKHGNPDREWHSPQNKPKLMQSLTLNTNRILENLKEKFSTKSLSEGSSRKLSTNRVSEDNITVTTIDNQMPADISTLKTVTYATDRLPLSLFNITTSKSIPLTTSAKNRKFKHKFFTAYNDSKISKFKELTKTKYWTTTPLPFWTTTTEESDSTLMNTAQIEDLLDLVKKKTFENPFISENPLTDLLTYNALLTYKCKSFPGYYTENLPKFKINTIDYTVGNLFDDEQRIYDSFKETENKRHFNRDVCKDLRDLYKKVSHRLSSDFKQEMKETADALKYIAGCHKSSTKNSTHNKFLPDKRKFKKIPAKPQKCLNPEESKEKMVKKKPEEASNLKPGKECKLKPKQGPKSEFEDYTEEEGEIEPGNDAKLKPLVAKVADNLDDGKSELPYKVHLPDVNTRLHKIHKHKESESMSSSNTQKPVKHKRRHKNGSTRRSVMDTSRENVLSNNDLLVTISINEPNKAHIKSHRKNKIKVKSVTPAHNVVIHSYEKNLDNEESDLKDLNVILNENIEFSYKPTTLYLFEQSKKKRSPNKIITPAPYKKRKKRKFFEDDYIDDQDMSTRSDDSWLKKHFYLFFDRGPPQKFLSTKKDAKASESTFESTSSHLESTTGKPKIGNNKNIGYNDGQKRTYTLRYSPGVYQPKRKGLLKRFWSNSPTTMMSIVDTFATKSTIAMILPDFRNEQVTRIGGKKASFRFNMATSHPDSLLKRIFTSTTQMIMRKVQSMKKQSQEKQKNVIINPEFMELENLKLNEIKLNGANDIETLQKSLIKNVRDCKFDENQLQELTSKAPRRKSYLQIKRETRSVEWEKLNRKKKNNG